MEVTLEAGLSLDLATKSDLDEHHRWLRERLQVPVAGYDVLSGSVAPGTAPLLLRLDRSTPPAGHLYVVEWVAIFGDDDTKGAITNVGATVRIGVPRLPATAVGGRETVIPGLAVPVVANVPDKMFVRAGQHVYVVIGGSASGSGTTNDWNANVGVSIIEDTDRARAWV